MTTSVLIPSYRRPKHLVRCLQSLAEQTSVPGEVIVVWQGSDTETGRFAEELRTRLPFTLRVVHSPEAGIVPAENVALEHARGSIILLVDDDGEVPADWIE